MEELGFEPRPSDSEVWALKLFYTKQEKDAMQTVHKRGNTNTWENIRIFNFNGNKIYKLKEWDTIVIFKLGKILKHWDNSSVLAVLEWNRFPQVAADIASGLSEKSSSGTQNSSQESWKCLCPLARNSHCKSLIWENR